MKTQTKCCSSFQRVRIVQWSHFQHKIQCYTNGKHKTNNHAHWKHIKYIYTRKCTHTHEQVHFSNMAVCCNPMPNLIHKFVKIFCVNILLGFWLPKQWFNFQCSCTFLCAFVYVWVCFLLLLFSCYFTHVACVGLRRIRRESKWSAHLLYIDLKIGTKAKTNKGEKSVRFDDVFIMNVMRISRATSNAVKFELRLVCVYIVHTHAIHFVIMWKSHSFEWIKK